MILIATLIKPSPDGLTLSRFLLTGFFISGLMIETYFEEMEDRRRLGEERYMKYKEIVKNYIVPNLNVLFLMSGEQFDYIKNEFSKLY